MKKEIWRPIKGYEGWYEVSSYGNVRSLDRLVIHSEGRKRLWKGKIMKLCHLNNGYLNIELSKNCVKKHHSIHRLVAEAFIPNPDNLPIVNHKDENPNNNHVSNLEWCTRSYNINYGTRNEKVAVKLSKPVFQIDKITNEVITEYPSAAEAVRQTGFNYKHISACCNGKRKTAGGFKWQYKE